MAANNQYWLNTEIKNGILLEKFNEQNIPNRKELLNLKEVII